MTTPNPRILSDDERRAAADGYFPGLLGAAMERILTAQDNKTRRATVEEARAAVREHRRPTGPTVRHVTQEDEQYNFGIDKASEAVGRLLAPPEPEMVEVIRYDSVTGIGNFARTIRIPLADFESYAKGGGK